MVSVGVTLATWWATVEDGGPPRQCDLSGLTKVTHPVLFDTKGARVDLEKKSAHWTTHGHQCYVIIMWVSYTT